MSSVEYTRLLSKIRQELTDLEKINQILYQCRTGGLISKESETYTTRKVNPDEDFSVVLEKLLEDLKAKNNLGIDNLDVLRGLLEREWALIEKIDKFEGLREDFNSLLDDVIRKPFNDDYTLQKLLSLCADDIPEVGTDDITDVRKLFKELEQNNRFVGPKFRILEKIVRETGDQDLMNDFKEYQKKWVEEEIAERRKGNHPFYFQNVSLNLFAFFYCGGYLNAAQS